MSSAGPHSSPAAGPASGGPASRLARRLVRWVSLAIVVAILAVPLGFLWFAGRVPTQEVALGRDADGIVVLTGGASRISDAFELLAAGRGKRLLISGVHHATRSREIAQLIPEYRRLFACCVDLDY